MEKRISFMNGFMYSLTGYLKYSKPYDYSHANAKAYVTGLKSGLIFWTLVMISFVFAVYFAIK